MEFLDFGEIFRGAERAIMNNISNFDALIRKSMFAFKIEIVPLHTTELLGYNRHNLESGAMSYTSNSSSLFCILFISRL